MMQIADMLAVNTKKKYVLYFTYLYSVLNLLIDLIALLVEMLFKLHTCIDVRTYSTSTNSVCAN
jgi:hypothetical protein